MPKFTDYYSSPEIRDIMGAFTDKFPSMFDGFDATSIDVVVTQGKKSKFPVKLHSVGYPANVFTTGKPYIVEVFDSWWKDMSQRQKNTSVFHVMCAIPEGGFDEQSKMYARQLKPEVNCFMLEFAATGGVPNWFDNPLAKDPLEREADDIVNDIPERAENAVAIPTEKSTPIKHDDGIERVPVTTDDIMDVVPA